MAWRHNIIAYCLWGMACAASLAARPTQAADAPSLPANLPGDWQVAQAAWADVNADGQSEWVLLVWRPWRDVHMAPFTSLPTLVQGCHTADGLSCHIIVIEPVGANGGRGFSPFELARGWRELWAGSALGRPLTEMLLGDVDGDGSTELVALEGDYATGRAGPAQRVTVWQWHSFGFRLVWHSEDGAYTKLALLGDQRRPGLQVLVHDAGAASGTWQVVGPECESSAPDSENQNADPCNASRDARRSSDETEAYVATDRGGAAGDGAGPGTGVGGGA